MILTVIVYHLVAVVDGLTSAVMLSLTDPGEIMRGSLSGTL